MCKMPHFVTLNLQPYLYVTLLLSCILTIMQQCIEVQEQAKVGHADIKRNVYKQHYHCFHFCVYLLLSTQRKQLTILNGANILILSC